MNNSKISIVDDDQSFRDSLTSLIESFGFSVKSFSSAEEFLKSKSLGQTDCLILDQRMPDMNGLELHRRLITLNYSIPTVFITGHGNVDDRTRAIEEGAVDYLHKPFSEEALMKAIDAAIKSGPYSHLEEADG
ncbi:MAG: response regulator transcription factor [Nitrospiria bacterium]